jgi:phospholipid transport system substrate-binding protein
MISRRHFALTLAAVVATTRVAWAADPVGSPVPVVHGFYDVLLSSMKAGPRLGFAGRRDKLAPTIRATFDFPLMTRLMVGVQWSSLPPGQQQQLIDAFSAFSIATYANRFDDYSGEQFIVEDEPLKLANGDEIVKSQLVPQTGDKVELDYLMRRSDAGWKAIDVYLSGTVSELATRRSEFSSVLRRGGASALVEALQRKVQELSS